MIRLLAILHHLTLKKRKDDKLGRYLDDVEVLLKEGIYLRCICAATDRVRGLKNRWEVDNYYRIYIIRELEAMSARRGLKSPLSNYMFGYVTRRNVGKRLRALREVEIILRRKGVN